MFYAFLVLVGLVALAVYVTLILHLVPGAAEERLGVLEPLPSDLGIWRTEDSPPDAEVATARGLVRQVRVLHEPASSWFGSERLVRQVRYRDPVTLDIVHVMPDRITRRRRIKRRPSPP